MALKFSVVTAEGVVEESEVDAVTLPTGEGEITVLPHHIPLVATLQPGVVTIRTGDDEHHLAVSGGFVQTDGAHLTVLADTAERADEIDAERAEQARKRAEEAAQGQLGKEEQAELQAAVARNLARLRATELTKHRRKRG